MQKKIQTSVFSQHLFYSHLHCIFMLYLHVYIITPDQDVSHDKDICVWGDIFFNMQEG